MSSTGSVTGSGPKGKDSAVRAVLVSIVAILCAILGLDYTGILGGM